jgi:pyruvate,water dikinase
LPEASEEAVLAAYRQLGGVVAVRSSAAAEDGAANSFAGQAETFLGVEGEQALLDALARCRSSLGSSRAAAYRAQQGTEGGAMSVVVQALVEAEVAGVLFTRDPLGDAGHMLVEASWGLGEAVVSGKVTPDRFRLDHASGRLLSSQVGDKAVQVSRQGESAVPPEKRSAPSLTAEQLGELAALGRKVEAYFGGARDIEWAWAGGRFWLLQARPITTLQVDQATVRAEEIKAARAKACPGGTVWARFNLAEVLPAPTPMTWALVRRMMSGDGACGRMYRDLGHYPDPSLREDGAFDLIAGRPYCNLSREPRMSDDLLPLEHPFQEIKADPRRALYPAPRLNVWRLPAYFWLTLPYQMAVLAWRMCRGSGARRHLVATFAGSYREVIAPGFLKDAGEADQLDLPALSDQELSAHFARWTARALEEFARESLKPTALAALCMTELEEKLGSVMPAAAVKALMQSLVMGVRPDPESDLPAAVRALAAGRRTRGEFLAQFGHRGPEEMELSRPRWRELSDGLTALRPGPAHPEPPSIEDRLRACPNLRPEQVPLLAPDVRRLHEYLALRETAKHHLMRGFAILRRALLEIGRRGRVDGGVFYLQPDELERLRRGEDLSRTIAERKARRAAVLALEAPQVLFSDDLEAIGRPRPLNAATSLEGVPLSAGLAEAPALVLEQPEADLPTEGYILVCPSTDPAWVPLFVHARGLVMETGGVLSHGAIVAREFGLPAVAGLPGVTRQLRTGQRLRVDGSRGTVEIVG